MDPKLTAAANPATTGTHSIGSTNATAGFSPPQFGKYGLPVLDEYAIEALAQALSSLGAGNIPVAKQQGRLRHALATFLIRCKPNGE